MMKRRQFIHQLAIGGGLLVQATHLRATAPVFQRPKSLILIQLRGGNDWYNTIVPYASDAYHGARPTIACTTSHVIPLDDRYGLHPALSSFAEWYGAGQLQVTNQPLLKTGGIVHSHHEAQMAWHRQLAEGLVEPMGTPGLEEAQPLCAAPFEKQVHDTLNAISLQKRSLSVYSLVLDGFDTHAFQQVRHDSLLASLNGGVDQLCGELKAQSRFEDALLIIYSEMGRSLSENNRKGTEHGGAGAMIAIGGTLENAGISDVPAEVATVIKHHMQLLMS